MTRQLLWMVLAFSSVALGAPLDTAAPSAPTLVPLQRDARAAHLAAEVLVRYHYRKVPVDDALSEKIFDQYVKTLDPSRMLFFHSDVDQFAQYRRRLDDALLKEDLAAPFDVFNRYLMRVVEHYTFSRSLLKNGFDFGNNEDFQFARESEPWPKTEGEARDLWRRQVKNDWLRLKLAGNDDRRIAEVLDKRYDSLLKRVRLTTSADAFQVFMNAYTVAIEPHTNYLGPRAAENFGISMRLSLVGIGAVLTQQDEYTVIRDLLPGGPAALSGQLKAGDRIVGVAQGRAGIVVETIGWRLDDTVALIRGEPDSVVLLDVLPAEIAPDGEHKRIALVRKKITLEAQAAKKSILTQVEGKDTRRIGVISLPSFYEDVEGRRSGAPDYRSASRDVARLLGELRTEKVDSVLIDLRNNRGGLLSEAVKLTGLFIETGPVVQQRVASGKLTVASDTDAAVAWNGLLGVLINRNSASASEIFAAAIQDYGRGLIIGETSFGKGTVQSLVDLDRIARKSQPEFGELKMTVAQFFRINGSTTQLRGVTPDITLPSVFDPARSGESSLGNALPWVRIKPAEYKPVGDVRRLLPLLQLRHDARIKQDPDFRNLDEDIAEITLQRSRKVISLNEATRRAERDARAARLSLRERQQRAGKRADENVSGSKPAGVRNAAHLDDGLRADERSLSAELAAEKVNQNAKDIFLNEAVQILGDDVRLRQSGSGLAVQVTAPALPVSD